MEIQLRDGSKNTASVYNPGSKKDVLFICMPALGVRASYYDPFAQQLSAQDYTVITIDWRGAGNSDTRPSRTVDFGYKELIDDLEEWTDLIEQQFPGRKKIIAGHSLGGQLGSLFASRYTERINGIVLITSCTVYYKSWDGFNRYKVWMAGSSFYPLSRLIGYFPGTAIGFGGKEARSVMRDWCINAMSGDYAHTDRSFNYEEALHNLQIPVLALSIKNDWLAPEKAVKHLYEKFSPEAEINHLHVGEADSGIPGLNHFSWVKNPGYFVELIDKWGERV